MATKIDKAAHSKAELIQLMAETKTSLIALVEKRNATESARELAVLEENIGTAKKQWNAYSHSLVLQECIETGKPTYEACRRRYYPVLQTKNTKTESGAKTMSVEESTGLIELQKLAKQYTNAWRYRAELLCLFYTKQSATSIGITAQEYFDDLTRFFKISDEAKVAEKASNRSVKEILTDVVSQMIGTEFGEKVISADVGHFTNGFTADDRRSWNKTKTADCKGTFKLLADICHRLITGGFYEIETKQLTKDGRAWAQSGFKHVAPVVQQKIEETPKSAAPESAPESAPDTPVSQKKSKASKESKAKAPRQRKAKTAATK